MAPFFIYPLGFSRGFNRGDTQQVPSGFLALTVRIFPSASWS